ncbi:hypothetical protein DL766_010033 [Monosporascus sp. MC13-8B]|uniref:Uncharacterized protein n=1 Tax=Monosporascus cannonballus TaxID=155416 RepID=A0ABY0GUC8_9PEZI|nr:hypothetical protein DL762_009069 [Monosporascus cannonballus]RYO85730.1 hypothetical protein DL763_006986 [Monosporascus cannonballus]RYP11533.1 hypothetical protein DL766_010033 [Monosporascus sp. MC13-8B]
MSDEQESQGRASRHPTPATNSNMAFQSQTPPGSSPRPPTAASSSDMSFQSQIPFSNPASVTTSEDSNGGGGPSADLVDHPELDRDGPATVGTFSESGGLRRDSRHSQSIVFPSSDPRAGADDTQSAGRDSRSQTIELRWHYSSTADVSHPIVTRFVLDLSKTMFEIARQVSICWPGRVCGRIEGLLGDGGQPLPLLDDSQVAAYVDMARQQNLVPTFAVQVFGYRDL